MFMSTLRDLTPSRKGGHLETGLIAILYIGPLSTADLTNLLRNTTMAEWLEAQERVRRKSRTDMVEQPAEQNQGKKKAKPTRNGRLFSAECFNLIPLCIEC